MIILLIIASFLVGVGVYHMLCSLVEVPTAKTSKTMLYSRKQQGIKLEHLMEVYLTKLAKKCSSFIHLDTMKQEKIQSTLTIAGVALTPEEYIMKAIVTSLGILVVTLPILLLSPLCGMVFVTLAIMMGFSSYALAFDLVKKRKKLIELEIPRFAMTIGQHLETDRDVLKLLTSYRKVAGVHLGKELDQTIADMKTSNYERALLQLEKRVNSNLLSDIVRGLIGTLRGDNQTIYFKMICFDMRQIEQNNLKKEAAKRPKQIQKYSMLMLFCIIIIYVVVLSVEVIGSLGAFF